MSRSARLLIAGLGALALGCNDAPTEAAPVKGPGTLTLTVVGPDGRRTTREGDASFLMYSPGPTPAARAMVLSLRTLRGEPDGVEISLWQSLPDGRDMPLLGSFAVYETGIFGRSERMMGLGVGLDRLRQAAGAPGAGPEQQRHDRLRDGGAGVRPARAGLEYSVSGVSRTSVVSATFVADRATEKKTTSSGDR